MNTAKTWFKQQGWKPYPFQQETWLAISQGYSGLLNAPTGCGKTYAIWFGVVQDYIDRGKKPPKGLHCLWITPLKALSKEIELATNRVSADLGIDYKIGLRTGDTSTAQRAKQKKQSPEALITTPESLHLMLAQKEYAQYFAQLQFVIVDEWHELLGSKRGVQVELGLSRLKALNPNLKIWGISATIGNLDEAQTILLGTNHTKQRMVKADIKKRVDIDTVFPDTIEKFPWAGHLGIKMVDKIIPIVEQSNSSLIFTNTRAQAEIWYRQLLEMKPDWAGLIAMHHGSLSNDIRKWVEDALHAGQLKAVVCTSSLDLGVDFRPVDTVIQIGSAKGVARFMQRAGRSGHRPGAVSKIHFVPTHSLEIVEGAAIRYAVENQQIESRTPYVRSFDVLIQYLVTLAVSDGFLPVQIFEEIKETHCFQSITPDEFEWCLSFITNGGSSLEAYDEFKKVEIENGLYKVNSRAIAMRHRLSIGTIASDTMLSVRYMTGKKLGTVEEWFVAKLKKGDVFWFAGRNLELVMIKDMEVLVRASKSKKGIVPAFMGGRMPLSSQLSGAIRHQISQYQNGLAIDKELTMLLPLFEEQQRSSILPTDNELLIEKIQTKEGHHVFIYPFEGRFVHEGMASILANRIAQIVPITFSIAMNDYGFELLSDQDIPIEAVIAGNAFSPEHLNEDVLKSMNITEMAMRRFRDISHIAGLVFTGYPGKQMKTKHLQASAQLFFKVFEDYEHDNLLLREAYDEVLDFQLEIVRMRQAFERINQQKIIVKYPNKPTPFCFPILTDRLRERFTTEELEHRIMKMKAQMEKW